MAHATFTTAGLLSKAGLWLGIAVLGAGNAAAQQPASGGAAAAAQAAELRANLEHLAGRYGVCTVAVAVVRNRALQSVETAHGCDADSALTQGSVFEAASLGKPVFAYAVLKLVQQGKMDLDAPVLKYLPQGYAHRYRAYQADSPIDQVSDPRLAAVTVRMALNHTSGLPNWSGGPLSFDGAPGARWQYSGEGYVLLQRAVEAVTGEGLDQFMQGQLFGPLGMTHSAYTRQAGIGQRLVPGSSNYGVALPSFAYREPVAAFTLYTSAGDYGRFLAALLQDDTSLRQIVASPVAANARPELSWGLGWGLERRQGEDFIWHWGNNSGYRNFVMASPRSGDGFVMFTNSERGMALAEPIGEKVLPGPHPVYRFHLLRDGLANLLCEMVDVCP